MKKVIIIVALFVGIFYMSHKETEVIIPKEAIRFRVIANSNSSKDQQNKLIVRDSIQKQMTEDLTCTKNIEEARISITSNLNKYNNLIEKTLQENNINSDFNINYGMNYFPKKVYKGVTYEAGNYESLVITLGDGLGKNWWCVMFPPLCLLEAEETEETTEVEYKFFIKELIDKYF
ncbi:MAG: stage II sporulation protein R [Tenericutes bacterium]|nr:stage II sporulation protein R [Mycoplasmatota bacterium]